MPQGTVHHDDDPGSLNKNVGYLREPDSHTTNGEHGNQVSVIKFKPYLQKGQYGFGQGKKNGQSINYELQPYYLERVDGEPDPNRIWIYIAEKSRNEGEKS